MKATLTILLAVVGTTLWAQTVQFENLTSFDKLIISGDVAKLEVKDGYGDHPQVTVEGVEREAVDTRIEAGVLYLELKKEADKVIVHNGNLHRIETDGEVAIAGADVIGNKGKYLITDIDHGQNFAEHISINIPDIDIDVPDIDISIPELDFDFSYSFSQDFDFSWDEKDWDFDFNWDWEDHKEEMKRMSKEVKEEVKRAMEEVKHEMKQLKEKDKENK